MKGSCCSILRCTWLMHAARGALVRLMHAGQLLAWCGVLVATECLQTWQVASVLAYTPMPEILDYACTKGAIVTMTKALAQQLISKKGIRVNGVAPGPIW